MGTIHAHIRLTNKIWDYQTQMILHLMSLGPLQMAIGHYTRLIAFWRRR